MAVVRAGIPPATLQQIRDAVDIVDVVSRYVTLSKVGQNHCGLCPFHEEKTPSFTVTSTRQMFYCFGCGVGGDVFTFLMRKEGLGFLEAVGELAEQGRVTLPQRTSRWASPSQSGQRKRLEHLHALAQAWFQRNLHDPEKGRRAMAYLAGRGFGPDIVQEFGLGYAPPSWDGLARYLIGQGASPPDLEASGLVVSKDTQSISKAGRHYDRFRGRVMIPIADLRATVVAFGGRVFEDGTPKYLNSPDTPLFHKGRCLYGLHKARAASHQLDSLFLVEGYFDVLALSQVGIPQVAAPLGTALTRDHVSLLRRFVDKVVLTFDGDVAGINAALRALDVFRDSEITVTVVVMPSGHDPDSYVRAHGAEGILALRDQAPTLLEFAVTQCLDGEAHETVEARARRVDAVLSIVAKGSNPVEKSEQVQRIADRLGVRPQLLLDRYPTLIGRQRGVVSPRQSEASASPSRIRHHDQKEFREERECVWLMVQDKLRPEHFSALRPEAFQSPLYRRLVETGLHRLNAEGRLDVQGLIDDTNTDDHCRDVVAELIASEKDFDDQDEYIQGCLRALERRHLRIRLDELIGQLRIAERERRTDDVSRLNSQIEVLRGEKAGLSGSTSAPR